MKDISHDKNAIKMCKYILNYIQNRMALLEEYREWISEGINQDYVFYLITKKQISDTN